MAIFHSYVTIYQRVNRRLFFRGCPPEPGITGAVRARDQDWANEYKAMKEDVFEEVRRWAN